MLLFDRLLFDHDDDDDDVVVIVVVSVVTSGGGVVPLDDSMLRAPLERAGRAGAPLHAIVTTQHKRERERERDD
jgi:hypothetical protein